MSNVLRLNEYHFYNRNILGIPRPCLLIIVHINAFSSIILNYLLCYRKRCINLSNELVKTFRINSYDRIRSRHTESTLLNNDEGGQCCTCADAEHQCMPGPLAKFLKIFHQLFRLVVTQVGPESPHNEHRGSKPALILGLQAQIRLDTESEPMGLKT